MSKLQRAINLVIRTASGSTIRSTPTESLLVETGFAHIQHKISKLQFKLFSKNIINPSSPLHDAFRHNLSSSILSNKSALNTCLSLVSRFNIPIIPPQQRVSFELPPWSDSSRHFDTRVEFHSKSYLNSDLFRQLHKEVVCQHPSYELLYVDASKSANHTLYAIVHASNNSFNLISNGLLVPQTPISVAEMFALYLAVSTAVGLNSHSLIFSDSKSSIQALRNSKNKTYLVLLIRSLLSKARCNIKLCWIPGHAGICGNEAADSLAKATPSLYSLAPLLPPSECLLFSWGSKALKVRNQQVWDSNTSFLHNHWPSTKSPIYNPALPRCHSVVLFRLRTGHTLLTHSYLFSKDSPPSCRRCSNSPTLTIHHLLTECQALRNFFSHSVPDLSHLLNPSQSINSSTFHFLQHLNLFNKI